ncbi:MAG: tRNA uridine-5-carboxymethylaminomethyl(34) synthesis GTPase MnmE, partial [Armatimonadota bacterium]
MEGLIVAPITVSGGAVAVVRLSGVGAWAAAAQVFHPWPQDVVPRFALYGHFSHGDDGIALPFVEGASYTGEESVELSCHGSPASVRMLVEKCLDAGARMAEPGEFTLRAFMNGRMDLTQAEGVRASVEALSDAQLRQASLLREGTLKGQVSSIRSILISVLASVEAATDFEEETGPLNRPVAIARLQAASLELGALLDQAPGSRLTREGVTVAILGRPNAGKSSLLNALAGFQRAIVTPHAGTTRDLLEADVQIEGHLFHLVDTAGLREATDEVEKIGVRLSKESSQNSDLVLYVFDRTIGWSKDDDLFSQTGRPTLVVANKSDQPGDQHGIEVSALTGEGIKTLRQAMVSSTGLTARPGLTLPRHVPLLESAREAVCAAQTTFESDHPSDLAAVHLQAGIRALGLVLGEAVTPDILHQVFADFCVGK